MKRKIIYFIILIVLIIIAIIFGIMHYDGIGSNTKVNDYKITVVVVKVHEKGLLVYGKEVGLCSIGFTDEGNIGFQKGQELDIGYDGVILSSYPAQIGHVNSIKITKKESETIIPEEILRYAYSSKENVKVSVSDFTTKGITITITDTNEIPYEYTGEYIINKKVLNTI